MYNTLKSCKVRHGGADHHPEWAIMVAMHVSGSDRGAGCLYACMELLPVTAGDCSVTAHGRCAERSTSLTRSGLLPLYTVVCRRSRRYNRPSEAVLISNDTVTSDMLVGDKRVPSGPGVRSCLQDQPEQLDKYTWTISGSKNNNL